MNSFCRGFNNFAPINEDQHVFRGEASETDGGYAFGFLLLNANPFLTLHLSWIVAAAVLLGMLCCWLLLLAVMGDPNLDP